jgi:ribonucleoside-diphosphate reductase alpha chain
MTKEIQVRKRNGRGTEPLDLNKIHIMVEEACKGLGGVSPSLVEIQSELQFYDGITTADIQETLIKSASDLISIERPNYQFVAARLLLFSLRKSIYHKMWDLWTLSDQIQYGIERNVYDPAILNYYSTEELEALNSYIDHERDFKFTYAGLRQMTDKYLVQDRSTGKVFETPQFMYMLIAATIFYDYPQETRLSYVKRYYDAISKHIINIPTPIMAGVRTPIRQYASCVLVDIDDTLDSIFASDMAIGRYTAQRAGIGINAGRIRAMGSRIRDGEIQHTGVIPFLRKFEATVRCCTQNGVRGGSATVHFPIWHREIEDIIVLKNNKGTEENRVRKLDYSIQMSKLFYERYLTNGNITLFSPHDVPGLFEAWGNVEAFDYMYTKYERDEKIPRKVVSARELIGHLIQERAETGRIYIMNIDHCNSHSSFIIPVTMSNLCQEITLPTKPLQHIDDLNGEIALCILSAVNLSKIKHLDDLKEICDLSVRSLDALIDYQNYPVACAEIATKKRRSLGVGFIGLAHYLAKHGVKYGDKTATAVVHALTEAFQYYLIDASAELAKEKGACEGYPETKYALGEMPIDHYKKDVDEVWRPMYYLDWDLLRRKVQAYGLRNSTLSAQMPSESSSVVCNTTNGIEPPRDYMSIKVSKKGTLKQIVPQLSTLKNDYTLAWDMETMVGYLKIVAVMQKFFDQAISANTTYNPLHYPNHQVPASTIIGDILTAYKLGVKTLYYQNTYDSKGEEEIVEPRMIDKDVLDMLNLEESCEACAI